MFDENQRGTPSMNNAYLNLVFDLDGTIIENGTRLNEKMADKLTTLSHRHNIIFASARPIRDMLPLMPDSLHQATFIGCNGGQAWRNGDLIYSNHFPKNDVKTIISYLKEKRVSYVIDGDWNYSFSETQHEFHEYIKSLSNIDEVPELGILDSGVTKILILDDNHRKKLLDILQDEGISSSFNIHRSDNFFDITPVETNKALALTKLKVDFDKSMAVGNDYNDYDMLNCAKVSVFVGNSSTFDKADYYCSMGYLFSIIDEAINNLKRSQSIVTIFPTAFYVKQHMVLEIVNRLIKVQKSVSSWIVNIPSIENKLNLSVISAKIGYSLKPLYGIILEKSILQPEKLSTPTETKGRNVQPADNFNFTNDYTTALKVELDYLYNTLYDFLSKGESHSLIYKRINDRMIQSLSCIKDCLDLLFDFYPLDSKTIIKIDMLMFESPKRPARPKVRTTVPTTDSSLKLLYSNYINLEVATTECCSDYFVCFDFNWNHIPFIYDISRQIEDEVNHSKILFDELIRRGCSVPTADTHYRFWDMARDEDLPTRLYMHQKMGEWIGIDAAIMQVMKSPDHRLSEIYSSILFDELHHTRLGTYWIDQFSSDYSSVKNKAIEKRRLFNETDHGPVKFPINEHVCELCNFKSDEILDLVNREKEFGAMIK